MKLPPRAYSEADPNAMTIDKARAQINAQLPRVLDSETIECLHALGRVCAADVMSPVSVPSFRASAMDGYAVRVMDCVKPLRVQGKSLAGHPGPNTLDPETTQLITTGARVPDDADAVIQQENVERHDNLIIVKQQPNPGLNIRNPGSDSLKGSVLIQSSCLLGAAQLALLAAHGVTHVSVYKPITIALFSTGDELVLPGHSLNPGQIHDANRPLLKALLNNSSVHINDLGICTDSEAMLENLFERASDAQLVISSGGVSVGEADYVRTVLERRGRVDLWKIAMKPGRPLTFGFSREGQVYFGLPGNPVSAAITTLLFVKPALRHMLGMDPLVAPPLYLPLKGTLKKNPGRVEYQRAIMSANEKGCWQVNTTGLQDSHVLSSLHRANCLIELSLESTGAQHGEQVRVLPFSQFADNHL